MVEVSGYVAKFRDAHQKVALDHLDWQKQMKGIEALELDVIKGQNELFRKQYGI